MSAVTKEKSMFAVLVRFHYDKDFNEARLRQIADNAHAKFEGMPGLRSKAFTVDASNRDALNFYVWESESAAKEFFTDQFVERVTGLYGVRPSVQYAQVAALVDNYATQPH
jgi:heme-degrading monooxygenase HmoA